MHLRSYLFIFSAYSDHKKEISLHKRSSSFHIDMYFLSYAICDMVYAVRLGHGPAHDSFPGIGEYRPGHFQTVPG